MGSGLGVDVHPYYQRGARFDGVEYAWIKMADGARPYALRADGRTWTADAHAAALRAAQKPFGGYLYAQPGDGGEQAHVLWNECLRLGGTGVAPADDIEDNEKIHVWTTREAVDHGRAFCSAMRRIGVRPAIYMNDAMAGRCRPDDWPEDPVLWIARYGAVPRQTRYDIHQYSSTGALPGSAGAVDWNQAYTTAHLLGGQTGGEVIDLDAKQDRALFEILEQFVGTRELDKYPGWDRLDPAEFTKATLVDFVRRTYAEVRRLQVLVSQSAAPEIDYGQLVAALPADFSEKLTDALADKLAARLAS